MATFALIHGASSAGFYWDLVVPHLTAAGHRVVAPDLPAGDEGADFEDYADAVDAALADDATDLVVVGQSLGGFSAPVVAARHPGCRLVLVAPMIPSPGETPREFFGAVNVEEAQRRAAAAGGYDPASDVLRTFFHDVDPALVEELMARGEPPQAGGIFDCGCPITSWPDVPTRVIACTEDRMFPLPLVERLARERVGVEAERLTSGHLPAFAHPHELAQLLMQP